MGPRDENGFGSEARLRLNYKQPYDWASMIEFLAARAIPGVEVVEPDRYRRTIAANGQHGAIEVTPTIGADALTATVRLRDRGALPSIARRIRRLFDLDADVDVIAAHLATDPDLAPLVRDRPGLRVPGAWDGFELAVRAILGQQITVVGARRLIGRLVDTHGEPVSAWRHGDTSELTTVFPAAARLARADLADLGMPRARAAAISGLAAAATADPDLFRNDACLDATIARLTSHPGIGAWTAHYIALRAMREPDAFPASDVGLARAMTAPGEQRPTPAAMLARAEGWRPWRAYAAQHLWCSLAAGTEARVDAVPSR